MVSLPCRGRGVLSDPCSTVPPMTSELLRVRLDGRPVGTVRVHDGLAQFRYDSCYKATFGATPLSLRLPLAGDDWQDVEGWLVGLMPPANHVAEFDPDTGWRSLVWSDPVERDLRHVTHWLGKPLGLDCAGAVQFVPVENGAVVPVVVPDPPKHQPSKKRPSKKGAGLWVPLERLLDERLFSFWEQHPGTGMTGPAALHGAQFKLGVVRHPGGGDRWMLPAADAPSTHILKPTPPQFDGLPVVEHLCLTAARNLGLAASVTDVAEVPLFGAVLVVERFDRQPGVNGTVRVHQEDVHQVLGSPDVYQRFGGPTVQQVGDLLAVHASSDDGCRFFEHLVFRWLACDNDGHAKNTSLQLEGDSVRLAPLYDVCSILPYADGYHDSHSMAMWPGIAGEDHRFLDAATPGYWEAVADELGVDRDWAAQRVSELAAGFPAALTVAADSTPGHLLDGFTGVVEELAARSERFHRKLSGNQRPVVSDAPPEPGAPAQGAASSDGDGSAERTFSGSEGSVATSGGRSPGG